MTEQEWLSSNQPEAMLKLVRPRGDHRRLRLFACACARELWPWYEHPWFRRAVAVAERFADGLASEQEFRVARDAMKSVARQEPWQNWEEWSARAIPLDYLRAVPQAAVQRNIQQSVVAAVRNTLAAGCHLVARQAGVAGLVSRNWRGWDTTFARIQATLCGHLRDIYGNPFRPTAADPAWLAREGGTVTKLARALAADGDFEHLPILADALEDAGCSDPVILSHLRSPEPHVRGCWVIDLLRGKE